MLGRNPNESFLDLYLRFTAKQESPELFHLWSGLTVLAAAMGRKCWLDRGYYVLYPNLFTILVAGSARCRKSTAINLAARLLDGIPTTKVISGKITPEKFIHELAEAIETTKDENGVETHNAPSFLVHSSELAVFLTKQSYGEPLIHILTDLFDCPDKWAYKTRNRGEAFLHNVFICILAATTPDGIAKGIPESATREGFASRIIFPFQPDTTRRNAFPELSDEERILGLELKKLLAHRATLEGEFLLTPTAKEWFYNWYMSHMEELAPDHRLEGMHGRKHDQLLRVAMILAGSYGSKLVDEAQLDSALLALNQIEALVGGAFAEMGGDDLTPHMERVRAFMRKLGRISYSELLMKMTPIRTNDLREMLETLMQTGEVKRDQHDPKMLIWNL